jgi:DNA-binding CsgD family transcriptional regulator
LRYDIIADAGRAFVFRHALLQEAAMSKLLGPERRRLHLRIAHAMERDPAANVGRSAALAYHYGRADDREAERLYAERAGDEAVARDDVREAATWYMEALRLEAEVGGEEPLALLEKAARLFVRNWRLADAAPVYDRLIAARREGDDPKALGETLVASAMVFFNDAPKRLTRLEEALEVLEPVGESPAFARAKAGLASIYLNMDHPGALDAGLVALSVATVTGARDAEAIALRVVGTYAAQSDIALGAWLLRTSIRLAVELNMNADAYLASFNLAGAYLRAGQWLDAEATLQPGFDAAVRQNVPDAVGTSLVRLAQIKRLSGNWRAADDLVAQARLRIDETDVSARMLFAFEAAYLDLGRGKWETVIAAIEPMCSEIDRKDQKLDVAVARELLARARLGAGDAVPAMADARRMLRAVASLNSYSGLPFIKAACEIFAATERAEDLRATIDDLRALHARLQVELDPASLRDRLPSVYRERAPQDTHQDPLLGGTAQAVMHGAEAALARLAGQPAAAITHCEEALAFWSAADHPYEDARCRVQLAECLLLRGQAKDRVAAREHLTAARATFIRLGAMEVGMVDALLNKHRLLAPPGRRASGLSAREREIASLIAAGMSNREIAAALVLAPKTVEHHVSRILQRLGLPGRAAIAAYASAANFNESPNS